MQSGSISPSPVTQTIWADGGQMVVFECARFYLSYYYFNPISNAMKSWMSPVQRVPQRVHNNFFTNLMVAHTLSVCRDVAAYLQAHLLKNSGI